MIPTAATVPRRRAVEVGSVDAVIRAAELRPRIIEAIQSASVPAR